MRLLRTATPRSATLPHTGLAFCQRGVFRAFITLGGPECQSCAMQRWHSGSDSKVTLLNLLSKCLLTRLVCLHVPHESCASDRHSHHPPAVVGKLNERQVLRLLQTRGPLSRAEVAARAASARRPCRRRSRRLLRAGLLEEADAPELARGRPAPEAAARDDVRAGARHRHRRRALRGRLRRARRRAARRRVRIVPTPATYPELLAALEAGRAGG